MFGIFVIVKAKGMLSRLKMSTYEFEGLDTSFDVACISLACISLACRTVAYFRGRASTGNENYISHPAQLGVKSSKKHT